MIGKLCGQLTIIGQATDQGKQKRYLCLCSCGNTKTVQHSHLHSGHTKSCGCLKTKSIIDRLTTHGHSFSTTYKAWQNMKIRCNNKSHKSWPDYGGRGITVCGCWSRSFKSFLTDMGQKPDGMELDRINNDGNYEQGNCRWTTHSINTRNRRSNVLITFNGTTLTLIEWSEKTGISFKALRHRIARGWTVERLLTQKMTIKGR